MNRGQKELLVNSLKQDFNECNASFLINIQGIPVSKIQALRKDLKSSGGKLKIAKNRLVKLAIKSIPCAQDLTPYLKQQLGVVFSKDDGVSTAKILYDFSQADNKLKIVVGCFESKILEKESLERIAKLPSREILLAQLCAVLKAPVVKLAQLVEALKEKKSGKES